MSIKNSYILTHCMLLLPFLYLASCTGNQAGEPDSPLEGSADTLAADSSTFAFPAAENAFERHSTSNGQIVYIPVYSHIYQHNQRKTFNLTATLSFRNTDPFRNLTLTDVLYYDSGGNLIKNFLPDKQSIAPLASTSFVVEEDDLRGGVGANFIVEWRSDSPIHPPVIEAVMISTSQQQGISFLSKGRVLQEYSTMPEDTSQTEE